MGEVQNQLAPFKAQLIIISASVGSDCREKSWSNVGHKCINNLLQTNEI